MHRPKQDLALWVTSVVASPAVDIPLEVMRSQSSLGTPTEILYNRAEWALEHFLGVVKDCNNLFFKGTIHELFMIR